MAVDRNAPAPAARASSKRCCQPRDEKESRALRLLGRSPRDATVERLPCGKMWEADIVPIAAAFDDDPDALPAAVLVCGNHLVLHVEILGRAPSGDAAVARALLAAIDAAREGSLDAPVEIVVRFDDTARALRELTGELLVIDASRSDPYPDSRR